MKTNNTIKIRGIYVGLLKEDFFKIESQYKKSTCHTLSEYVRKLLSNKPVTIMYRNESLDDLIEEIVVLNSEMNNTKNSALEVLEKLDTKYKTNKLEPLIIELETKISILSEKINEVKNRIEKITHKWLQS